MNEKAVERLRKVLGRIKSGSDDELSGIAEGRDEVIEYYGAIFSQDRVAHLEKEDFKSFLLFKNNKHWKSIHRQGSQIVEDMPLLRRALEILVDETKPIEERLRVLRPKNGDPLVRGLARSVITPILLVVYPDRYGVLNQVAESAMRELGLWPDIERGADFAIRYVAVNNVLQELAQELEIDLWTLDALWWGIGSETENEPSHEPIGELTEPQVFDLEQYLHEFLRDNWDRTELGSEWMLFEEDGEVMGYKYNTGVGEIDLLAKRRDGSGWLVVELKRGRTSDRAVGQALRYRGWVRHHLADPGEPVRVLVIGHEADPKLMYALEGLDDVEAREYSVRFSLKQPQDPWAISDEEK